AVLEGLLDRSHVQPILSGPARGPFLIALSLMAPGAQTVGGTVLSEQHQHCVRADQPDKRG
ncbi:MAG: hypothetical protein ACK5II_10005, partial [Paracoccus sp. (in: a-proteobacteria)]